MSLLILAARLAEILAAVFGALFLLTAALFAWEACRARRLHAERERGRQLVEVIDSIRDAQPDPEPGSFRADGLALALRQIQEGERG